MALGSIVVRLTMATADFETDTKRAASIAEKRAKEIDASFKRSALAIGAALGTAVVAGVGIAASAIRDATDRMDDLSKAALRVSLPTEQFSGLVYAGKLADVEMSTLTTTLGRLTKAQADAMKVNSEQAKTFGALKIAVTDAEGGLRSSYDVLLDFADAFQRQQGSPEIVAAGMKVFGRSFQELIPLIKDGSEGLQNAAREAELFGQIISTDTGKAAEAFNDNLSRMGMLFSGLAQSVAAELLPDMKSLSDEWVSAATEGDRLASTAKDIADALRGIADWSSKAGTAVFGLRRAMQGVTDQSIAFGEMARGIFTIDTDQIARGVQQYKQASIDIDNAFKRTSGGSRPGITIFTGEDLLKEDQRIAAQMRAQRAEAERLRKLAFGDEPKKPGRTGGGKSAGKSEEERELEQTQRAYESLMSTMGQRIALFNTEGEAARVRYDTEHGALKALDPLLKAQAVMRAEELDQMERLREEGAVRAEWAKEETDRIRDGLKIGEELVEDLEFELALMKMSNAERATAIQLYGMSEEAIAKYGKRIKELNQDLVAQFKEVRFLDGMRGEFKDFILDVREGNKSIEDSFKGLFDGIASMIADRIAQNWVDQLFGEAGSSSTGSAGGWMSMLAGLFGGGRAVGGGVSGGKLYAVNERGVETLRIPGRQDFLMTGNSAGQVVPAHQTAASGRQFNQNLTQVFQGRMSRQTAKQAAAESGRAARRQIARGTA